MKKAIIPSVLLFLSLCAVHAQDRIVKKDGTVIEARIVKEDRKTIQYKDWEDTDGPVLTLLKDDVASMETSSKRERRSGRSSRDKRKREDLPAIIFQMDEEGEPYLTRKLEYTCSAETAWKRLKTFLQTIYSDDEMELSENAYPYTISIKGAKRNSKVRYNPLIASGFGDDVVYSLTCSQNKNGEMSVILFDLSIESIARGIVKYNKTSSMRVMLRDYEKARRQMDDQDLSEREYNEVTNTARDLASSLSKAREVLEERMESIARNVE